MRLMSFAATIEQMRDKSKTVTRRIDRKGWWAEVLSPGTLVCACEKTQGIPAGGSVQRIGVIEIVDVRREALDSIEAHDARCETCHGEGWYIPSDSPPWEGDPRRHCPDCAYGVINAEAVKEGFKTYGEDFIGLFCHINDCEPDAEITRIEFRHRPDLTTCCGAEKRVQVAADQSAPEWHDPLFRYHVCAECGEAV